jgi:hypothetical protein
MRQACGSCLTAKNQIWRQEIEFEPEERILHSRVRNLENRMNTLEEELEIIKEKLKNNKEQEYGAKSTETQEGIIIK